MDALISYVGALLATGYEREELQHLIQGSGNTAAARVKRPGKKRILLKILRRRLGVSPTEWRKHPGDLWRIIQGTVSPRIKQRFTQEGLAGSLWDRRQADSGIGSLDDRGEAST